MIVAATLALLFNQPSQPVNLALSANATASESQSDELGPTKAIDGKRDTRWSGIPGHNSGVWYELRWTEPVTVSEVFVRQYDRYTFEWDLQTWDGGEWVTQKHFGKNGVKLPIAVTANLDGIKTTGIRIANITNGPSFTEIEVYATERAHPPFISLASDLRGNFVGMVSDTKGDAPFAGQPVTVVAHGAAGLWKKEVTTDEHGMFTLPMPLGLRGQITTTTRTLRGGGNGAEYVAQFDAALFQRGLTPLGTDTPATVLGTGWLFALDPPAGFEKPEFNDARWSPIKVPAHWEMQGFRSLSGIGGYRKHFAVPAGQSGDRTMLRFDGVYSGAEVWVNGTLVAKHEGGFTPFEADITDVVKSGDNVLAVRVREHTRVSDDLDKMSLYADFPLSGIIRKVTLFQIAAVHIEGLDYETHFSNDGRSATISGNIRIANRTGKAIEPALGVGLAEAEQGVGTFASVPKVPAHGSAVATFSFTLKNPRTWTAEDPQLYTMRLILGVGTGPRLGKGPFPTPRLWQILEQKIGLRETTIRGSEILINGRPVKIRGTCHHDQDPLDGRAVTYKRTLQDLRMIKNANLNSLRTSHYPPIPELLDIADELGLYVEDEASFCWVGASDDLRNTPRILQLEAELLARDRNHPSVFMWSLCNESSFGYGFDQAHEFVRKTDPSRPTSAAISTWDTEIATLHNPISIKGIRDNEGLDKPLLVDEAWCIYQGIWNDVAEMWVDPGVRDYYVEPLPAIWDVFMKSKVTQGSQIWAWSDDLFLVPGRGFEYGRGNTKNHFVDHEYAMPGRGIVGDAPWGVVDGWRREKPEYWLTKKLQSPIKMKEAPLDPESPARLSVINEYDFLNLSQLKVTFQRGFTSGELHLNVPPRSTGEIQIPTDPLRMSHNPLRGDLKVNSHDKKSPPYDPGLTIRFRDPKGRLIDAYHFPPPTVQLSMNRKGSQPTIREEFKLAGNVLEIIAGDVNYEFDKDSGMLRRCVVSRPLTPQPPLPGQTTGARGSWPLLLDLPALHLLPTESPTAPIPLRTTWRLQEMKWAREGNNVRVTITGSYPSFEGAYDVLIDAYGGLDVHSKFTYTGPDRLCREIGLVFSVPRECDTLHWERNAEWNVYPPDHIGRPVGTAPAFYDHPESVPPKWPWSHDNTPLGSNDFRSTKRNIRSAWIGYPTPQPPPRDPIAFAERGSPRVEIFSDGKHALRAMVDTDRILVNVNDWYGGTNVGLGEWVTNYGRGKTIKNGDVLESTIHLRMRR